MNFLFENNKKVIDIKWKKQKILIVIEKKKKKVRESK